MIFQQFPHLNFFDNVIANISHFLGPIVNDGSAALSNISLQLGLF